MTSSTEMISVRSMSRDRSADGERAVENCDEMLAARNGGLERWDRSLHRVDGGDDVGAGLAEDQSY